MPNHCWGTLGSECFQSKFNYRNEIFTFLFSKQSVRDNFWHTCQKANCLWNFLSQPNSVDARLAGSTSKRSTMSEPAKRDSGSVRDSSVRDSSLRDSSLKEGSNRDTIVSDVPSSYATDTLRSDKSTGAKSDASSAVVPSKDVVPLAGKLGTLVEKALQNILLQSLKTQEIFATLLSFLVAWALILLVKVKSVLEVSLPALLFTFVTEI